MRGLQAAATQARVESQRGVAARRRAVMSRRAKLVVQEKTLLERMRRDEAKLIAVRARLASTR